MHQNVVLLSNSIQSSKNDNIFLKFFSLSVNVFEYIIFCAYMQIYKAINLCETVNA